MNKAQYDTRILLKRLKFFNASELCRRADIPRHRITDAQSGRSLLIDQEINKLNTEIQNSLENAEFIWTT